MSSILFNLQLCVTCGQELALRKDAFETTTADKFNSNYRSYSVSTDGAKRLITSLRAAETINFEKKNMFLLL